MSIFDVLDSIRRKRGMKVADFMRSFGMRRASWYVWRGGNTPGPRALADIERTLNIRFLYDGDEIIGWEDVPVAPLDDVIQMSYTVESDPHGGGSATTQSATGENRVLAMYRQDSEGTGLPQWEALSHTQKEYVRNSYLALLQNMQKEIARRRMELIKEIEADLAPDAKV